MYEHNLSYKSFVIFKFIFSSIIYIQDINFGALSGGLVGLIVEPALGLGLNVQGNVCDRIALCIY